MNASGGTITYHFKGDSKNLNTSISSVTKGFLAATGITKLVSAGFNMIQNSVGDAVSRLDTLNNFPKVMKNLGISTSDSEKAIKKMSDKLTGLPTTLNTGAMAVQRFTSANGDIQKSTDIFLALNNAILAGGASTEIQSSALEQMSQAYAKGKPDMIEWRSLMTAMPAQLKQVATAMGFISADALGESLRNGETSMDSFMNTIIKLNNEGINGFASFEEQAKGSVSGINTSMTNMKTAVARGMANVLNSLDKGLKEAGLGGISGVLTSVGKGFEKGLKSFGKQIPSIIKNIQKLITIIQKLAPIIVPVISAFVAYNGILKAIKIVSFISKIGGTVKAFMSLLPLIKSVKDAMTVLNIVFMANPIVLIVAAIAGLVAGFIYLWNTCKPFKQFWINLWNGIKNIVSTVINFVVGVFNGIINFVKTNWQGLLLFIVNPFAGAFKLLYDNCEGFRTFINNFVSGIINFVKSIPQTVSNIVKSIISFIGKIPYYVGYVIGFVIGKIVKFYTQDIPNFVTGVITWIQKLPGRIVTIFTTLGTRIKNWFTNVKNKTKTLITNFITNMVNWFKSLPGKIYNVFTSTATKVRNWFNSTKSKAKTKISSLITAIVNGFKSLPSKMMSIGQNAGKAIWNGVKGIKDWVIGKIKGFGEGIINGMKKALGIHSPSKEFAIIGKFSVLGYTEQLDKMKSKLQSQIQDTFEISPQLLGRMNSTFNPNVNVTIQNNMTTDPLGQVVSKVKTFSGGSRNDYNYGMG